MKKIRKSISVSWQTMMDIHSDHKIDFTDLQSVVEAYHVLLLNSFKL